MKYAAWQSFEKNGFGDGGERWLKEKKTRHKMYSNGRSLLQQGDHNKGLYVFYSVKCFLPEKSVKCVWRPASARTRGRCLNSHLQNRVYGIGIGVKFSLQLNSTNERKSKRCEQLPELSCGQSSLWKPQSGRSGGSVISSVRISTSLEKSKQCTKLQSRRCSTICTDFKMYIYNKFTTNT